MFDRIFSYEWKKFCVLFEQNILVDCMFPILSRIMYWLLHSKGEQKEAHVFKVSFFAHITHLYFTCRSDLFYWRLSHQSTKGIQVKKHKIECDSTSFNFFQTSLNENDLSNCHQNNCCNLSLYFDRLCRCPASNTV